MSQQQANIPINLITIVSGIVFTFISWLVISVFGQKPFLSVFIDGQPLLIQLAVGIVTGSVVALLLIYVPIFSSVRRFGEELIGKQMNPKKSEIPLIAVATGVGEELLFRAVIQPFIGIFITSLLFMISHGGFDFKKQYIIQFNIFLFMMSVLMGVLYLQFGLVTSIAAHIAYNIGIMLYIQSRK